MPSLGIDIGGTRLKAALVDSQGIVLQHSIANTEYELELLVALLRRTINQLAQPDTELAITSPGLAAADNASIAWMRGRLDIVEGVSWSQQLDREVSVLNDAHAATLGEAWVGAAAGLKNVVMLTLGTGVGGGVILNGQLFQGTTGRAGHLGHITINAQGTADIVGMPGSLEDAIGNHNISERTEGRYWDTSDLVAAVEAGEPLALGYWEESVNALAAAVASLINAFDPEVVIIGGGIAESGATLFDRLRNALDLIEWQPFDQPVAIVPARLGDLAGAIGAARFANLRSMEPTTV